MPRSPAPSTIRLNSKTDSQLYCDISCASPLRLHVWSSYDDKGALLSTIQPSKKGEDRSLRLCGSVAPDECHNCLSNVVRATNNTHRELHHMLWTMALETTFQITHVENAHRGPHPPIENPSLAAWALWPSPHPPWRPIKSPWFQPQPIHKLEDELLKIHLSVGLAGKNLHHYITYFV